MDMAQKILYDKKQKMMKDLRAGMKVRLLEADIRILESQNNQQIKDMELIRWYIVVMEQGIDA